MNVLILMLFFFMFYPLFFLITSFDFVTSEFDLSSKGKEMLNPLVTMPLHYSQEMVQLQSFHFIFLTF